MLFSVPWCWYKAGKAGMRGYQQQFYSHIPNPVTPILPSSAHASPSQGGAWLCSQRAAASSSQAWGPQHLCWAGHRVNLC